MCYQCPKCLGCRFSLLEEVSVGVFDVRANALNHRSRSFLLWFRTWRMRSFSKMAAVKKIIAPAPQRKTVGWNTRDKPRALSLQVAILFCRFLLMPPISFTSRIVSSLSRPRLFLFRNKSHFALMAQWTITANRLLIWFQLQIEKELKFSKDQWDSHAPLQLWSLRDS